MRATPSADTGISPFTMVTGTEVLVPNLCFPSKKDAVDPCVFTQKLAEYMELMTFKPTSFERSTKFHVPKELATCEKVWLRVDRLKRPLESPYAGPFSVVNRNNNFFTIRHASGKTENVAIGRLKPVIQPSDHLPTLRARSNRLIWNSKQQYSEDDSESEEIPNDHVYESEVPDENPNDMMT